MACIIFSVLDKEITNIWQQWVCALYVLFFMLYIVCNKHYMVWLCKLAAVGVQCGPD